MAANGGWSGASLKEVLSEKGSRFNFYQAVRLLQLGRKKSKEPGEGENLDAESARFKSEALMGFPPSDVVDIVFPKDSSIPVVKMASFGIAGNFGPLPIPYTMEMLERVSYGDTAMRDFLDIFNHRLVSLLYQIRKKNRLGLVTKSPEETDMAFYLYSLLGLSTSKVKGRMKFEERSLLLFTGLLQKKPLSSASFEKVVSGYFEFPIKLTPFVGQRESLKNEHKVFLGENGQNQILGKDTTIGETYWDQHRKVELELGPLSYRQFHQFLGLRKGRQTLKDFSNFLIGPHTGFDARLAIRQKDIPLSWLPMKPNKKHPGFRLGWNSWLKTKDTPDDESINKETRMDWRYPFNLNSFN